MPIGQIYPPITCTTSSPENLKMKVESQEDGQDVKPKHGNTKKRSVAIDDILNAHWSLQPPRFQTQIRNPRDLRKAVTSALSYNGDDVPGTTKGRQTPTFLPFSGNFILDKTFTLAKDTRPLLEKVQELNSTQKAECAAIAQQLMHLVAEVDGFKYVKQGSGSPLQGSRTVTGWYFHYVCEASKERYPKRGDRCDCKGSIYVSMSAQRMYIYYTHRELHETVIPRPVSLRLERIEEQEIEETLAEVPVDAYPRRPLPTPPRKSPVRAAPQAPVSPPESLPIESPFSVNGSDIIVCPNITSLPRVHPTPVEVNGSVYRNYTKLRALRDLVDAWLPEDGLEEEQELDKHANPFLQPIFGFMVEWFKSSMEYPKMQQEIYKILDLENNTGVEDFLRENRPGSVCDAGGTRLTRSDSPRFTRPLSTEGSEISLSPSDTTERSWRPTRLADLLELGYGSLGTITVETPIRSAAEKRKSEDMCDMEFNFGVKKRRTRTGI